MGNLMKMPNTNKLKKPAIYGISVVFNGITNNSDDHFICQTGLGTSTMVLDISKCQKCAYILVVLYGGSAVIRVGNELNNINVTLASRGPFWQTQTGILDISAYKYLSISASKEIENHERDVQAFVGFDGDVKRIK